MLGVMPIQKKKESFTKMHQPWLFTSVYFSVLTVWFVLQSYKGDIQSVTTQVEITFGVLSCIAFCLSGRWWYRTWCVQQLEIIAVPEV